MVIICPLLLQAVLHRIQGIGNGRCIIAGIKLICCGVGLVVSSLFARIRSNDRSLRLPGIMRYR